MCSFNLKRIFYILTEQKAKRDVDKERENDDDVDAEVAEEEVN